MLKWAEVLDFDGWWRLLVIGNELSDASLWNVTGSP